VIALDMNRTRLVSLAINAVRLGIRSAVAVAADASKNLSSLFRVRFDRMVVDAPCSGLGVISRHPMESGTRKRRTFRGWRSFRRQSSTVGALCFALEERFST